MTGRSQTFLCFDMLKLIVVVVLCKLDKLLFCTVYTQLATVSSTIHFLCTHFQGLFDMGTSCNIITRLLLLTAKLSSGVYIHHPISQSASIPSILYTARREILEGSVPVKSSAAISNQERKQQDNRFTCCSSLHVRYS